MIQLNLGETFKYKSENFRCMNSKGQELSLTTIILAALGLIILVVLAAVFTGRIGGFGIGLGSIQANAWCNQACKDTNEYVSGSLSGETCSYQIDYTGPSAKTGEKCCCNKE